MRSLSAQQHDAPPFKTFSLSSEQFHLFLDSRGKKEVTMFDLEEEIITLGIYRFPWLIRIQLFITFLLILIILYYFILFGSSDDLLNSTTTSNIIPSSSSPDPFSPIRFTTNSFLHHHHHKIGESRSVRGETGTSSGLRIVRSISNIGQNEDTISTNFEVSENSHHLCQFFGLAKQAFLKCFGLDFTSESRSSRKRKKEE